MWALKLYWGSSNPLKVVFSGVSWREKLGTRRRLVGVEYTKSRSQSQSSIGAVFVVVGQRCMRGMAARKIGVDASGVGRSIVPAVSNSCFPYKSNLAMEKQELHTTFCIACCLSLERLTNDLENWNLPSFLSLADFFCSFAAMRPERSTSKLLFRYHWSKLSSCCLAAGSDWALIWSLNRWERWDFEAICVKRWETSENWGVFGHSAHCSWIELSLCLIFGMINTLEYELA